MIKIQALTHHARIHLLLIFTSLLLVVVPVLNKIPSQQVAERSMFAASQFLFLVDTACSLVVLLLAGPDKYL